MGTTMEFSIRLLLLPTLAISSCLWENHQLSCRQAESATLRASLVAGNISTLGIIDIFASNISWIGEDMLTGLSHVTELTLKSSQVSGLHGSSLTSMDRIESVALSALNTLRRLDMSNNQLTSISSDILANLASL